MTVVFESLPNEKIPQYPISVLLYFRRFVKQAGNLSNKMNPTKDDLSLFLRIGNIKRSTWGLPL